MRSGMTVVASFSAFALLASAFCGAAAAQYRPAFSPLYEPLGPGARMKISIEPMAPVGPAIDTDEGGMYGGLRGGFGYYFVEKRFVSVGMDAKIGYAVPIVKTWDSYYEHSGNFFTTSFGLPVRLGGKVAFAIRPALVFEVLNHTVQGYDPVMDETWRAEFKGSFAFGFSGSVGFDTAITNRVSLGFGFEFRLLVSPHECTTDWYSGTTPSPHHYDTRIGRVTILGFAALKIGI